MRPPNETERLRDLYQGALAGDMAAGRELIRECRRGMVVPFWESESRPTDEVIEKFLKRRQKAYGS